MTVKEQNKQSKKQQDEDKKKDDDEKKDDDFYWRYRKKNMLRKRITIRVSDTEYKQIDTVAKRLHMSQSAVVRAVLFQIEPKKNLFQKIDKQQHKSHNYVVIKGVNRNITLGLIASLNRIGNNINQIAHQANRDLRVPPETKKELEHTNKFLKTLLGVLGCHM